MHAEPRKLRVVDKTEEWHVQCGRDAFIECAIDGNRVCRTVELRSEDVSRSRNVNQVRLPTLALEFCIKEEGARKRTCMTTCRCSLRAHHRLGQVQRICFR